MSKPRVKRSNRTSFRDRADAVKLRIDCRNVFREYGAEVTGHSPFREDNSPSFSLCHEDRGFRDHATGDSGDLIDLILRFEERAGRSCDKNQALEIAEGFAGISATDWTCPDHVTRPTSETKSEPEKIEEDDQAGFVVDLDHPKFRDAKCYVHSSGDLSGPFDVQFIKNPGQHGVWIRECADGKWRSGLQGRKPFLFVPSQTEPGPGDFGIVTEGHSDCVRIHGLTVGGRRIFAVSLPFSSANFRPEWIADIFSKLPEWSVIADSGEAGERHARKCKNQILAAGIRARTIDLPGFDGRCNKPGKRGQASDNEDLKNWLNEYGHDVSELVAIIEETPASEPLPEIDSDLVLESLVLSALSWIEASNSEDSDRCLVRSCLSHLFTEGTSSSSRWLELAKGFERAQEVSKACLKYAREHRWTTNGQRRNNRIYGGPGASNDGEFLEWTDAQTKIQANEDDLFSMLELWLSAVQAWRTRDAEISAEFHDDKRGARQARRKAKRAIIKEFGVNPDKALRELWRYTAGSGKSESALRLVKRLLVAFPDVRVLYLVPYLKLAEDMHERALSLGIEADQARIFRGKTQDGVCMIETETRDENGEGVVSLIQSAGFSAASLCEYYSQAKDTRTVCRHRESCEYFRLLDAIKRRGGVTFAAHSYASVQSKLDGISFDLVIMDESFENWHRSHKIFKDDLSCPGIWREDADQELIQDIGERLWQWIEGGCLREEMDANGWSSAVFKKIAGQLTMIETTPYIRPNMSAEAIRQEVSVACAEKAADKSKNSRRLMARLLDNLRIETKHQDKPVQSVHVIAEKGESAAHIRVEELRKPKVPKDRACLILDATASELIARRLYGKDLVVRRINTRRNLILHQVVDSTFSKTYLGIASKDPVRTRGFERTVKTLDILKPDAVICPQEFERRIESRLILAGVVHDHFGNFVGSNRFSDCVTAAIIGRNEPSALIIEAQARALNIESPKPLLIRGHYSRCLRWYNVKGGGQAVGVLVSVHDDGVCQAILESIREAQLEQAIDRLRTVHVGKTAEVWLLCNVPVPGVEISDLIDLDSIIGEYGQAGRAACAWNRTGFFSCQASGEVQSRLTPDLFETPTAAKRVMDSLSVESEGLEDEIIKVPGSNKYLLRLGTFINRPRIHAIYAAVSESAGDVGPVAFAEYKTSASAKRWCGLLIQLDKVANTESGIREVWRRYLENTGFELADFRVVEMAHGETFDTTSAHVEEAIKPETETSDQAESIIEEEQAIEPEPVADISERMRAALNMVAAMIQSGFDRVTASRIAFDGVGLAAMTPKPRPSKKADSERSGVVPVLMDGVQLVIDFDKLDLIFSSTLAT